MSQEYVELIDQDTGDSVEVTVNFEFDVEPTEYEGAYVFYQGGASMTDCEADPYTFKGKEYRDIPAELFPYIWFNDRFYKEHKLGIKSTIFALTDTNEDRDAALKVAQVHITDYMEFLFEEFVAPNISVPVSHYADGRFA